MSGDARALRKWCARRYKEVDGAGSCDAKSVQLRRRMNAQYCQRWRCAQRRPCIVKQVELFRALHIEPVVRAEKPLPEIRQRIASSVSPRRRRSRYATGCGLDDRSCHGRRMASAYKIHGSGACPRPLLITTPKPQAVDNRTACG